MSSLSKNVNNARSHDTLMSGDDTVDDAVSQSRE
jgi:hypothetical protein